METRRQLPVCHTVCRVAPSVTGEVECKPFSKHLAADAFTKTTCALEICPPRNESGCQNRGSD